MSLPYAQIIKDTETDSSGCIRRAHKSKLIGKISLNGSLTLYESFARSVLLHSDRRCVAQRPTDTLSNEPGLFLFRTYAEIGRSVKNLASGLVREEMINPNEDGLLTVGLFFKNSPAWIIAENACYYLSAVPVPLYDTLQAETIEFIINQTGLETIICSSKELKILGLISTNCPSLKTVVITDLSQHSSLCAEIMRDIDVRIISLYDLERIGANFPTSPRPPKASDIATICYTSGTTGKPKGALITHQNLISVMTAGLESMLFVTKEDLYLSFLPLPHIFERIVVNSLLASGAGIGFYRGDILKVVEDLIALQPTIFCAVPRLYTRIHDKVSLKITSESGLTGQMLRLALATKLKNLRRRGQSSHKLWDSLVFSKIKGSLGLGRVRLMISGGAPLPGATMEFFRVLLGGGCTCHEGYGQTETTGATSMTTIDDLSLGNVGGPFPCCEIRLVDVPDMGYLQSDLLHDDHIPCQGRGEVWVRGPGVIQGYYKDEEETKAAGVLESGNWLRSGDIGMWTPKGQLVLIDRKKNLFKLSQGEYIAVEKVEGILSQSPLVSQLFVHGDSSEDKLVAIVVPDEDAIRTWSAMSNADKDLHSAVLDQMKDTGRRLGLKGYELVYAVTLENISWTPENNILTPTMKLKRVALQTKYRSQIQSMYQLLKKEASAAQRSRL